MVYRYSSCELFVGDMKIFVSVNGINPILSQVVYAY